MPGINEIMRDETAIYSEGTTVPQNTSVTGTSVKTGAGGQLGACMVVVQADTAISIDDTKAITMTVTDSSDNSSFVAIGGKTLTSSGATTYGAGDVLFEFVLPENVRAYTNVTVATTDAAATGKFSAFVSYLAR